MKRRDFLKSSVPLASIPLYVGGMPVSVLAETSNMRELTNAGCATDRVLVLVFLDGGNDGINTLIPIDQYDILMRDGSGGDSEPVRRPDLMVPESSIHKISDIDGFHPGMEEFKNLFNEDKLGIIRNAGYPNPNKSHFRSTDIWNTGSSSEEYLSSGWLGRHLSKDHPNFPDNYPNENFPDPLALTIGRTTSHTCQGPIINMGIAVKNLNAFVDVKEGDGETPDTPYGHELAYIRNASKLTNDYLDRIEEAANKGRTSSNAYPEDTASDLAQQLETVAKLIDGGLQTRIYVVRIGGFDTHDNQVEGDPESGRHAYLLDSLSKSIAAFQSDIIDKGLEERILTMTYSEFGRRVFQNKSEGTDHGEGGPMFFVSPYVNPEPIGKMPSLAHIDNIAWEYDFRSAYGSVLMDWFCVEESTIKSILYEQFEYIPILVGTVTGNKEIIKQDENIKTFPNPFVDWVTIEIKIDKGPVRLYMIDSSGKLIKEIINKNLSSGTHKIRYNASELKNGLYFIKLQNNKSKFGRSIIKYH
tara:strand:+ start:3497 stop:5080 length:1584 start_codon:yes stop_codon:yes gene_type:complete